MATENYYELLGVPETATHAEIKTAYRQLAKKHHPDKGGDGELFARINQAYDTLSDEHKRAEYDNKRRMGEQSFSWNFNPNDDPFANLREQLRRQFGFDADQAFGRQYRQQMSNKSIRLVVKIDAASTLQPQEKTISFKLPSGTVKNVELKIPKGVEHNQSFIYKGLGDDTFKHLPAGDLLVRVEIYVPDGFGFEGHDIFTEKTINCIDAMTGCELDITNFDGSTLKVSVPPGTQHGARLALMGQGLPHKTGDSRGRLIIFVNIYILKELDDESIRRLKEINNTLKETV